MNNKSRSRRSSSDSSLSLTNEPKISDVGQRLFRLAMEQNRNERRQARDHRKRSKNRTKKVSIKIADIDRIFEEKRQRQTMIREDLMALYRNSSERVRSMLSIDQIERFLIDIDKRSIFN